MHLAQKLLYNIQLQFLIVINLLWFLIKLFPEHSLLYVKITNSHKNIFSKCIADLLHQELVQRAHSIETDSILTHFLPR